MTWKGWVKVAFHQPLIPVLPVARELIRKTKWVASKGGSPLDVQERLDSARTLRVKATEGGSNVPQLLWSRGRNFSPHRTLRKKSRPKPEAQSVIPSSLMSEPGSSADSEGSNSQRVSTQRGNKGKVKSLFSRSSESSTSQSRKSTESDMSTSGG